QYNQLTNMKCAVLNRNNLSTDFAADVLLMSDVNYQSNIFDELYSVLHDFLLKNTTILLSTPQRLLAKPFIDRLLPFCIEQSEELIEEASVSVFVLKYH